MWQQLQQWVQTPSTERLGWAVLLSLLLHFWLFGGNLLSLPSFEEEYRTIEARLQAPKKAPPNIAPKPAPKPVPKQTPKPQAPANKPALITEAPAEPAPQISSQEPAPVPNTPVDAPVDAPSEPAPAEAPPPEPPPEDVGLVINQNAYQYVRTDFDVATKIDGAAEGTANITYDLYYENQYKIKSLTQPSGLAALVIGDLIQESKGELVKDGLQPRQFTSKYGKRPDKAYQVDFQWEFMTVIHQSSKGEKTDTLIHGTQDLLSFMYQFMFVPPLLNMQIPISNGKRVRVYDYQFDGEEQIKTPLGEINTLHISRGAVEGEDNMELWLAPQYQYLPVKIRKTEKDGKVYELKATRINTERPDPTNQPTN